MYLVYYEYQCVDGPNKVMGSCLLIYSNDIVVIMSILFTLKTISMFLPCGHDKLWLSDTGRKWYLQNTQNTTSRLLWWPCEVYLWLKRAKSVIHWTAQKRPSKAPMGKGDHMGFSNCLFDTACSAQTSRVFDTLYNTFHSEVANQNHRYKPHLIKMSNSAYITRQY